MFLLTMSLVKFDSANPPPPTTLTRSNAYNLTFPRKSFAVVPKSVRIEAYHTE